MPFFLSDENKSDLTKLDQAIEALYKARDQKSDAMTIPDTTAEHMEKLKLDYAAINEMLEMLVLIKRHIEFILAISFYSNDEISQLLHPISNGIRLTFETNNQEQYINSLISKALECKDEKSVYFLRAALGLFILSFLSALAIGMSTAFFPGVIAFIALACMFTLTFYDRKKEFNDIQNNLKSAQDGTSPLLKIEQYPGLSIDSNRRQYFFTIKLKSIPHNTQQYRCHINVGYAGRYRPVQFLLSKELTDNIKNDPNFKEQAIREAILQEYNNKGNVTSISYTTYNNDSSKTIRELYAQPRQTLRGRFFESDNSGSSLAEKILNQNTLTVKI